MQSAVCREGELSQKQRWNQKKEGWVVKTNSQKARDFVVLSIVHVYHQHMRN